MVIMLKLSRQNRYMPVNPVPLRVIDKPDHGRFFSYAWSKLFQVNGTTFCRTADRKHQDMTDCRPYHFLIALTSPLFFSYGGT